MRTILILATAAGCAASTWHAFTPHHRAKTTTTQKAVIAVTDASKEVETSADGVVLTKWFSGSGFGEDGNRFRIRVVVTPDSYDITALCQFRDMDPGSHPWIDCKDDKRPQFVIDAVAKIEAGL